MLRDVSVDIGPGEILCLLGEEGSGKSLLLRLITRDMQPDEGVIKIDTAILSQLPRTVLRLYRSRIGLLPQEIYLDPSRTIEQNIALPLDLRGTNPAERDRAVADLVKRFHLGSCAQSRPRNISSGERQLAAIAQAIVTGPAILLLDEPFQGLSDAATTLTAGLLENMRKRGTTIIIASAQERTAAAFKAPRILRVHRGKLTEEEPSTPSAPAHVQEIAEAATADLVERSSAIVKPIDAEESVVPEKRPAHGSKKIKITSVGSL